MTKKRTQGAPASRGDNGIRGNVGSGYTRTSPQVTYGAIHDTTPATTPDINSAQRNRQGRQQLTLFRKAEAGYEREYSSGLLKDLKDGHTSAKTFKAFFTQAGLALTDIACECSIAPDAKDLETLTTTMPEVRNVPRDASFKITLTSEQYTTLNEAYQDKATGQGMARGR